MEQLFRHFQRNHVALAKGSDPGAAQGADMAKTSQGLAEIARQRPHIGALAAVDFKDRVIGVGAFEKADIVDAHLALGQIYRLAGAGEVIGPRAIDLDCRKGWRALQNIAARTAAMASSEGRSALAAT